VKDKFEKDGKWEFPGWMLSLLKHFKFLRGTPLNVLAWGNPIRKQEIEAIPQYQARIEQLLDTLNDGNYGLACEAASYPSLATGYEKVKRIHHETAENFWHQKFTDIMSGNGPLNKLSSTGALKSRDTVSSAG